VRKKAVLEGAAVNYNPPGFTRLLVTSHVALYALVSVQGWNAGALGLEAILWRQSNGGPFSGNRRSGWDL